jgi:hypothetical protein
MSEFAGFWDAPHEKETPEERISRPNLNKGEST